MKRPVTVVKGPSALALVAALALALALSVAARPALAENRLFVAAGDGTHASGPYEGLATEAGLFGFGGDIAPTAGGGFLFAVTDLGSMVLRVNAKGRISRLAGTTKKYGFRGDGGPATKALMHWVQDVAVSGDGGFLVVDNCRVRAVGRDGIIRTVAGSGPPRDCSLPDTAGPAPGDGGPATAALLRDPLAVASLPGGGFLVAEGNRVRRVASDGKISTVAGTGAANEFGAPEFGRATAVRLFLPRLLAPLTGGGFLVTDQNGVHRVRPDGIIVPVGGLATTYSENGVLHPSAGFEGRVSGGRPGYFGGYGDLASNVPFDFEDIEPTADGGLLLAGELQVFFIAPPRTTRLGIAVARETLPALLRRRVRFRLTRAARVKMKLYRGRHVVARRTVSGAAGLNTLQLPRRTEPGLRYLKLRALAPDGSVATNALRVLVGPWLPNKVAAWQSIAEYACFGECGGIEDTVEKCRRFGPRRVDCVMGDIDLDTYERDRCTRVVSSVLRRSGYLYIRPYGCRKRDRFGYFRGRPSYTGAAKQGRPL